MDRDGDNSSLGCMGIEHRIAYFAATEVFLYHHLEPRKVLFFFDSMNSWLASKTRPIGRSTMMKFKFILCRYELFEFYIDQKEELEAKSIFECMSWRIVHVWRITDPVAESGIVSSQLLTGLGNASQWKVLQCKTQFSSKVGR